MLIGTTVPMPIAESKCVQNDHLRPYRHIPKLEEQRGLFVLLKIQKCLRRKRLTCGCEAVVPGMDREMTLQRKGGELYHSSFEMIWLVRVCVSIGDGSARLILSHPRLPLLVLLLEVDNKL